MYKEDFSECLLKLYNAAVDPARWRPALDAVADTVDGKAIAVLVRKPSGWSRDLQLLSSRYLDFTRTPAGMYYAMRYSHLQNPDWDFLSRCDFHVPTWDIEAGQSAEELDRRKDYAYLRNRLGVSRRLGVRLNPDRLWFDAVSVAYDATISAPNRRHIDHLYPVLPHLAKAIEMGRIFMELRKRYSAALLALDNVDLPMWVLGSNGEVVVSNKRGHQLTDANDGLSVNAKGYIECTNPDDSQMLARAISSACATASGRGDVSETVLPLKRRSEKMSYLVDVAPLSDAAGELNEPLAGALLTVIDPERLPNVNFRRFGKVYQLTKAETDVCALAFSGLTLEEIAKMRETSPTTTKNQMAQILVKTETNRRADLARLILKTHPPTI